LSLLRCQAYAARRTGSQPLVSLGSSRERVGDDRGLIAAVPCVGPKGEAGIAMTGDLGECRRGEPQVGRKPGHERVPERVSAQPLVAAAESCLRLPGLERAAKVPLEDVSAGRGTDDEVIRASVR